MNDSVSREATSPGEGGIVSDTTALKQRQRCCCNLLHVVTATLLIGCLELCYFAYEVFSTIYHFIQTGEQYVLSLSVSLFGVILAVVAVLLLFVAIRTSTPYLLVPHLLMQAAAVCILSLMCLFCIFALTAGTSLDFRIVNVENSPAGDLALGAISNSAYELTHISKALALFLSLVSIILLAIALLEVWMLTIVLRCFFHLQEKAILKVQPSTVNTEGERISVSKTTTRTIKNTKSIFFASKITPTNPAARAETDC